jgi:hypothetical protein
MGSKFNFSDLGSGSFNAETHKCANNLYSKRQSSEKTYCQNVGTSYTTCNKDCTTNFGNNTNCTSTQLQTDEGSMCRNVCSNLCDSDDDPSSGSSTPTGYIAPKGQAGIGKYANHLVGEDCYDSDNSSVDCSTKAGAQKALNCIISACEKKYTKQSDIDQCETQGQSAMASSQCGMMYHQNVIDAQQNSPTTKKKKKKPVVAPVIASTVTPKKKSFAKTDKGMLIIGLSVLGGLILMSGIGYVVYTKMGKKSPKN